MLYSKNKIIFLLMIIFIYKHNYFMIKQTSEFELCNSAAKKYYDESKI